jgi:hypothetical protein
MREIFRAAAEKSTGLGKPYFERLSKAFNTIQDTNDLAEAQRAKRKFVDALEDIQQFAETDPDTAKILLEVSNAISQAAAEEKDKPAIAPPSPPPAKKKPVKVWRF